MQIKWVYRYMDPAPADWKDILDTWTKDPQSEAPNPSRREAILDDDTRKQIIDRLPKRLKYWSTALRAFGKLKPTPKPASAVMSTATPLFHMRTWRAAAETNHQPLDEQVQRAKKAWTEGAGVRRVRDLWSNSRKAWKTWRQHRDKAKLSQMHATAINKRAHYTDTVAGMSKERWRAHTKLLQEHITAGGTMLNMEQELTRRQRMETGDVAEVSRSYDPLAVREKRYIQMTPDRTKHDLEILPGGQWRTLTSVYKGTKGRCRPTSITGDKKRRKIAGPTEEVWPPMDSWTIGTAPATDNRTAAKPAWPSVNRSSIRKRRGKTESIATAKMIATVLSNQGWKGEATMKDAKGKLKRQTCPPWELPNAHKKYQALGIGNKIKWKAVYRGIRGSTLLHEGQTEAKYKLYSGATWTRTCGKNKNLTGTDADCRLCGEERETKEHLCHCKDIRPIWHAFYIIIDEAQGNKKATAVTQDRIFFGLDHKNRPLRGILMDLHTLFWKMIVWKFTAQDADELHPKFSQQKVITLALEALAQGLMAHQQRMSRAKSRRLSDKQKDPEARLSRVAPLAMGHRKGKLVLQRSFALTLAAAGIDAFKENQTTTELPTSKEKSNRKGGSAAAGKRAGHQETTRRPPQPPKTRPEWL